MTQIAITGNSVFIILSLLICSVIACTLLLRLYWKKQMGRPMKRSVNSPLKCTGRLRGFGICLSLIATISLMSWTQSEKATFEPYDNTKIWEMEVIEVSNKLIAVEKKRELPKIKREKIIELVKEEVIKVEKPKFIPEELPDNVKIVEGDTDIPDEIIAAPAEKIELPPEQEIDVEKVFSVAEHMPRFPGCDSEEMSESELKACSEQLLLQYISKHLKYPAIARENGIQGRVTLRFIVDESGNIGDIQVLRGLSGGCSQAAEKVIKNMVSKAGLWTPGKQRGRKVKVRYTLPISFTLAK